MGETLGHLAIEIDEVPGDALVVDLARPRYGRRLWYAARMLQSMNETEFRRFSRYSFHNHAANVARTTGRAVEDVEAELGGPATSRSRDDLWLIAREADEEVGYGWLRLDPRTRRAYVMDVHVLPAFRGRGLGRRLMAQVVEKAAGHGMTAIDLTVRPDNTAARQLYTSLGFRPLATEPTASGDRWSLTLA